MRNLIPAQTQPTCSTRGEFLRMFDDLVLFDLVFYLVFYFDKSALCDSVFYDSSFDDAIIFYSVFDVW